MTDAEILEQIRNYENDIEDLLGKLEKVFSKPINNKHEYLKQLEQRKEFLVWANKKYSLLFKAAPTNIYKRDIFYCELGFNIGSEQKNKRPVVILQNNNGNRSSATTIVAPITTHENSVIKKEDGKYVIEYINDYGKKVFKTLDYYEIPVELEEGFRKDIKGYINLAQIRTVSKKRLNKGYVAKITTYCTDMIQNALKKLLP